MAQSKQAENLLLAEMVHPDIKYSPKEQSPTLMLNPRSQDLQSLEEGCLAFTGAVQPSQGPHQRPAGREREEGCLHHPFSPAQEAHSGPE